MERATNLILTSIDSMTLWGPKKELLFALDDLQNVSIQNNEETTDITGKNGRKLATLKQSKTVTITGANGVVSAGMLATQTGGAYDYKDTYPVSWAESLIVDDGECKLSYKPVGLPGMEIRTIVRETVGGQIDTIHPLKQVNGTPEGEDEFSYDPVTQKLTFYTGSGLDQERYLVRVYYTRNVAVTHVDNPADKFAAEGYAIFDCTARDMCQNYFRSQLVVPRADFTGNFTLEIGQDQVLHNFELNALASINGCDPDTLGQDSIYWDFIVFNRDADDVEDESTSGDDPENP